MATRVWRVVKSDVQKDSKRKKVNVSCNSREGDYFMIRWKGGWQGMDGREKQCSQPSSPSVFGFGRDGLRLIVRLFRGARTDYAREGEDRTDYREL